MVISGNGHLAIRQGQWKYLPHLDLADGWQSAEKPDRPPRVALFDLSTDKGERKNLLQEKPKIARRMAYLFRKAQSAKSTRPLSH